MTVSDTAERFRPAMIAETLRKEILRGVLAPGDRLREREVAHRFDVSRGPAREALRLLSQERLVELEAHKGARVATLSFAEIIEMFEVRCALISLAARLMAIRGDDEAIERFERAVDKLAAMAEARASPEDLVRQGSIAAGAIVAGCQAPHLQQIVANVARVSRWHYTHVGIQNLAAALEAAKNWRAVAAPLKARDPDRAEAAVTRALRFVQERAVQALLQQNDAPVRKAAGRR